MPETALELPFPAKADAMEEKTKGMTETDRRTDCAKDADNAGISPNRTEDAFPGAFVAPDANGPLPDKEEAADAEPDKEEAADAEPDGEEAADAEPDKEEAADAEPDGEEAADAEPDVPMTASGNAQSVEETDEAQSSAGESRDAVLAEIRGIAESVAADTRRVARELRDLHRLYYNEYTNRLIPLEEEMSFYREAERGRIHDDILREIAKLYSENIAMVRQAEGTNVHKQLSNMFLDLLNLLSAYGVRKQESAEGEARNARYCQVVGREETDEPEKHNTVKKSVRVGFYAEGFEKDGYRVNGRPLVKEMVEVFTYRKPDKTSEGA